MKDEMGEGRRERGREVYKGKVRKVWREIE